MEPTELDNPEVEHERRDVPVKAIALFLVGLCVSTMLVALAMWGLFRLFEAQQEKGDPTISPLVANNLKRTPPRPRLETNPLELMTELRAREQKRLEGYSWADQTAGVARIPIERAIDLIAERGVPGGSAAGFAPPAPGLLPATPTPELSSPGGEPQR